ncbi:MAG: hypothetical protein AAGA85_18610 [Bacteroidota bacterium]
MSRLTLLLTVLVLFVAGSGAISQDLPKQGILIKMDNHELNLTGGQAETKVYYLRSKRLRKVKLEAPSVQTKEGLDIALSPIQDEADAYLLTVKASPGYEGTSTLMIDGVGRWGREMKSTSFTVASDGSPQISKNQ